MTAQEDSRLTEAYRLMDQDLYGRASDLLLGLVTDEPENVEAWTALAQAYDRVGNIMGASEAYRKSLSLMPDQAEVWISFGNFYFRGESYSRAADAYQSALKVDPENAKAHNNLGTVLKEMDRLEEAVTHFAAATKYDGTYALAYRNAGDVHILLGNFDEAIRWLRKATSVDPENLFGWYWLGRAYVRTGRPEAAVPHFLRVISRRPDLPQVHHDLGQAYFMMRDYGKAIDHVKTAMRISPSGPKSYITLSRIYLNLGRQRDALGILENGTSENPSAAELYIEMGDIHKAGSRHSDALDAYTRAVALEPDGWMGHYKRGVALYYLSQLDAAEISLYQAAKLNERSAPVKHFRGMVALAKNEPAEAQAYLTEASVLESGNPDIWFHLGQSHQRLSEWRKAQENLEKAYQLNPRKSEILYGLSEVNKKLGDPERARFYGRLFSDISRFEEERDVLEKKLSGSPNDTALRLELAAFLEEGGALGEAAEYLRQAAYLGDQEAAVELERLERLLSKR